MATLRETYVENTREALLVAGRRLFAERHYGDVTAEVVSRAAGLTRGALYHHFDGKRGLFEAVFAELELQAASRIRRAVDAGTDPFDRADRGTAAFLDVCEDDQYRHVVLRQGPVALGWQRWRELDQQYLGEIVVDVIREVLATRLVAAYPADLLAAAFYGALTELSLAVADATDRGEARRHAASLQHDLLAGLRITS